MKVILIFVTLTGIFARANENNIKLEKCRKYIDMTYPFGNITIYWPGVQPFEFTKQLDNFQTNGFTMYDFEAGEHGGTHLDAPYQFYVNGWKAGEIPLERLISNGALLDVSKEVSKVGPNFVLLPKHLDEWQRINGPFDQRTILLIKFGYSVLWRYPTKYMGTSDIAAGKLRFPGISAAAAEWIVDSGNFYGVGVDVASVDVGNSTDFPVHHILSRNLVYAIENAKIVEYLPARGFKLYVLPMKIEEGTGAPLRLVADVEVECTDAW